MTKGLNLHPLPPIFQQWLKYAMDNGTPQDVVNMVVQQQDMLQKLAEAEAAKVSDPYGIKTAMKNDALGIWEPSR